MRFRVNLRSEAMLKNAALVQQLHTLRDFIRYGASEFTRSQLFFGHGTDNAWDEATALVLHGVSLPAHAGVEVLDARLTVAEKQTIIDLFGRRVYERMPAPYLTGEAWFAGLPFRVDQRVLIPRSPIAELIEQAFTPWLYEPPQQILDMCTGSGCIGIGCATVFPDAQVLLSDISSDALAVAKQNIAEHTVSGSVDLIQSDLFANINQQFDLIVSNPPYVDARDLADMPPEFHHEPRLALASGTDGLDFTRRLLGEAAAYLTERGCLCVEVGNSRAHLEAAFPQAPFYWVELEKGGQGVFILYREQLVNTDWSAG